MLKVCSIPLQIALIYRVDKMISDTEAVNYILGVPAEFVPMTMVIALVVGLIGTFAMSLPAYYEQDKIVARSGGEKLSYGLSYLSANIITVIACVVLSLVIIGWYAEASGAIVTGGLCYAVAFVVSIFIGFGGSKLVSLPFVESYRNKAKAADARAGSTETATVEIPTLNKQ